MKVETPPGELRAARELLGLAASEARDPAALKRAYRKLIVAHPPDRDPERFRAIRAAYDLLLSPVGPMCEALQRLVPAVPPPKLSEASEASPPVPGAVALAILRAVAADMRTSDLLPESSK